MDGALEVDVTYLDQKAHLSLVVVTGGGPSLMELDWLHHIKLDGQYCTTSSGPNQKLGKDVGQTQIIFEQELGNIKGVTAKLYCNTDTQ